MQAIVEGTAQAPFAYRILAPYILVAMGNTPQAYVSYHMVMFAVFFSLLWAWARRWQIAPVGVLLLAALAMVVMLPTYYFSSWSIFEWTLLLGGLLALPSFLPLPVSPAN